MARVSHARFLFTFATGLVVLGSVACSSATTPTPTNGSPAQGTAQGKAVPAAVPAAQVSAAAPAPAVGAAPAPADAVQRGAAAPAASAADNAQSQPGALSPDRMVIRTAQLTVEVTDLEKALQQVRQVAQQGGGFVSASNTRVENVDDQERNVADLTIQVRAASLDEALSALRALGKVTVESSGSQDVTEEYVDLDSNLRNLQASESAILKLMDKATRIEDVLSLQRELTNVRGQIERLQGRKRYLERRTDMATITLALRLPSAQTARPSSSVWDPLAVAQRGWQASLNVLRGVANVVIVAAAFSWWLVPFIALGAIVWSRRRSAPPAAVTAPDRA